MILAIAIKFTLVLSAQNKTESNINKISYGVKGGVNISNATDKSFIFSDGYLSQKSRIGFNGGAFVNIPISKSFSIQPELLFSQYGYKTEYDFRISTEDGYDPLLSNNKGTYSTNLGYIVIPIMVQYNIIPDLYVEVGSEFGINIIAQEKYTETADSYLQNRTIEIGKDFLNTFNFGVGAGAGYYFTDNIGITGRYIFGLTDTEKNPYNFPNKTAIRNKVFQIGLAYKF